MITLATVTFGKNLQEGVELRNCWPVEDGFVWSAGMWAEIVFPCDLSIDGSVSHDSEIVLDLDVFKAPPALEAQNVFFYMNGLRVGAKLLSQRSTLFFDCLHINLRQTENVLSLDTPDAAKPSQFGANDCRILGVKLFSLQVIKRR